MSNSNGIDPAGSVPKNSVIADKVHNLKSESRLTSSEQVRVESTIAELSKLQNFLAGLPRNLSEAYVNLDKNNASAVEKQLQQLNILIDKNFEDPKKLIEAIKTYDFDKIRNELERTKEFLEAKGKSIIPARENLEALRANINSALQELEHHFRLSAHSGLDGDVGIAKKEISNVEAPIKRENNHISRLINILNTISGRDPEKYLHFKTNLALEPVIKQQIEALRLIESSVKLLLISPSGEGQISTLLKALQNIDVNQKDSDNALQKEFKLLAADLKNKLLDFTENRIDINVLQDFLRDILKKIYTEFKLPPLEVRINSKELLEIFSLLKPEQVKTLKMIEAQIKLILNSPHESLVESGKTAIPKAGQVLGKDQLVNHMKKLEEMLEILQKSQDKSEVHEGYKHYFKNINNIASEINSLKIKYSTAESVQYELFNILSKAESLLFGNSDKDSNSKVNMLNHEQSRQLQVISSLINEILKLNADDSSVLEGDASTIKLPAYKHLITLLKRIDQSLPSPESDIEQRVVDFSSDLLQKIEGDFKSSPQKITLLLRKALEKMENEFFKPLNSEEAPALSKMNLAAIKNLENMLLGQEFLQRMSPAIRSMGEPVMLLFPFFIYGMLAKLEVSIYGDRIDREKKEKAKKKRQKRKESAYHKTSLKLNMPHFGAVHAELIYNDEEILIRLELEEQQSTTDIMPYMQELESAFKSRGFLSVIINIAKIN